MQKTSLKTRRRSDDSGDIPDPGFERIRRILRTLTGFHLLSYKDACIRRRLAVRMRAVGCATAEEYADLLMRDRSEPGALIETLTIHVSRFFRNPATFDKIRDEILPTLFARSVNEGRRPLGIRSIGCSTGEEPYTLALIVRDSFAREMSAAGVSITASDVDPRVLRSAARGVYEPDRVEGVPPRLLDRYFRRREDGWHLVPEIRNMVEFRQEDLLRSASGPECDLILCRNVLIYFDRFHQEAILNGFAESLPSGGVLVLGKTETLLARARGRFRALCPVERIYRKI